MNSGRYVLAQLLDLVHWQTLTRLVGRYDAESRVKHFGCRQQLLCMTFAPLTWREGLRDIATCLNAKPEALYHLGFREPVAKSTLADANEQRDWRLWEDLARGPLRKARSLDGVAFDRHFVLGDEPGIPIRIPGLFKGGRYGYPYLHIMGDRGYVIYSVNKEDIAIGRFRLGDIAS